RPGASDRSDRRTSSLVVRSRLTSACFLLLIDEDASVGQLRGGRDAEPRCQAASPTDVRALFPVWTTARDAVVLARLYAVPARVAVQNTPAHVPTPGPRRARAAPAPRARPWSRPRRRRLRATADNWATSA